MSSAITVLVADDHARTRALVRLALEHSGEFRVCAEAHDTPTAIAAALDQRPEVCLLDINMPGSGIAAAARITAALPETAVVMLTVSRQDDDLFDALRAGASGYLLKGMDEEALGDALHRVLKGESALPGSLVARLVEEFQGSRAPACRRTAGRRGAPDRARVGRARTHAYRCVHCGHLGAPVHLTDHGEKPRVDDPQEARRP